MKYRIYPNVKRKGRVKGRDGPAVRKGGRPRPGAALRIRFSVSS